jgi:hypothetical protein
VISNFANADMVSNIGVLPAANGSFDRAKPHKAEEILLTARRALKRRTMCDTERTAHTALNDLLL